MRKVNALSFYSLSPTSLAMMALFVGIVCFSIGNVITRFTEVGPSATAFYRLFLAMPMTLLWGMAFIQPRSSVADRGKTPVSFWKAAPWGIACGLCMGGEIALMHHAYTQVGVSVTVFLNSFAPLFVVFGAWLLLKQRPARSAVLCLIIAAPGAFLLSGLDPFSGVLSFKEGSMTALMSAVLFAGFIIAGTQMRKICSAKTVLNWTNVVACLLLAPLAVFNQEQLLPMGWEGWAVLVAIAFISQVLGMKLYTQAMGGLSSTFISFSSLLQPILTMMLAWVVLDEKLTALQMAGAVIVLISVGLNNLRTAKA
jgi:drug/metabolite transporter (DMT)-like permease